ncbi:MAG: ribosome hibernation-promoting factor, HPF/YfiA family [Pikeienuella sp.]
MRIQVNGKHIDVGEALTSHVETELTAAIGKYSDRPIEAVVTFSKDAHEFKTDMTVKLSEGLTAKASSRGTEIYAAFDSGAEKVEKQLRRYKRRLKQHRGEGEAGPAIPAASYVLAGAQDTDEDNENLSPVVIAEMKTDLRSLSVGEAVMQMELEDAKFLMFRNDSHGRLNIVFRREDGNIGWIDPENLAA